MSATGWVESVPFIKYPSEKLTRTIDVSRQIPEGVTVTAVQMTVLSSGGTDMTGSMLVGLPSVAAATVFTVQGGTAGYSYTIKAKFTLSHSDIVIVELPLTVIPE